MPDKNYRSYENLDGVTVANGVLVPDLPTYADTMKVFQCTHSTFKDFYVVGSKEDVLDLGRESCANLLTDFRVKPVGRYVVTCKGGSHYNSFTNWLLEAHGEAIDFEFGNWHSLNFDVSRDNVLTNVRALDGKPVTYCYRWGCRPLFIDTPAQHLWWRSVGLTVYWWVKYIAHRILRVPDNY